MSDLAKAVLELEGLREEKKELVKVCNERIERALEEVIALARDEESQQLTIDGGPAVEVIGRLSHNDRGN